VAFWSLLVGRCLFSRQRSLWEWDDFVFALALQRFSPDHQVPHPPFYPGYVGLARAAFAVLADPVLALTLPSVAASMLTLVFFWGAVRDLFGRKIAYPATLLLAFFPAAWLHAGVPLSDPAGVAAALGAWWLAIRAARQSKLLLPAAAAFACSFSIRPQVAVLPLGSLLVACRRAPARRVASAAACAIAGFFLLYLLPILIAAEDLPRLWAVVRYQTGFVLGVDSLPAHGFAVGNMLQRYFVDIWGSPVLAVFLWVVATIGAVELWRGHRAAGAVVFVTFAPYAVLAWVLLNPSTAGRYALPYLPGVAILVALGLGRVEGWLRLPRGALAGATAVVCGATVAPAVFTVASTLSPPVAAARALEQMAGGPPKQVVYAPELLIHAAVLFPGSKLVAAEQSLPSCGGDGYWFGAPPHAPGAVTFSWPHQELLRRVGRGRYLTVRVAPVLPSVRFGKGFYPWENDRSVLPSGQPFRWMGPVGELWVPRHCACRQLRLALVIPALSLQRRPEVSLWVGGVAIARTVPESERVQLAVELPVWVIERESGRVELRISETFRPAASGSGDSRVLGLQVRGVELVCEPSEQGSAEAR